MSTGIQLIKDFLVRLGPDSPLVHAALKAHARRRSFEIRYSADCIILRKSGHEMVLGKAQYIQVPQMMELFDFYFNTVESQNIDGRTVLDFSKPGLHRYIRSQMSFYFPSLPEDDVMDAYTHSYTPQVGDVVWDVGAHAGATAYFFGKMVGPYGKVYAFEPDANNFEYLKRNIDLHGLTNVIPLKKALSGSSGVAEFCMDGTAAVGLSEYLSYSDKRRFRPVSTITLPDACTELGEVPKYIKMDIEGAEVAAVEAAKDFLANHPIHFSIESNHPLHGELTYKPLDRLFSSIGYTTWFSDQFGQMFTWAKPHV